MNQPCLHRDQSLAQLAGGGAPASESLQHVVGLGQQGLSLFDPASCGLVGEVSRSVTAVRVDLSYSVVGAAAPGAWGVSRSLTGRSPLGASRCWTVVATARVCQLERTQPGSPVDGSYVLSRIGVSGPDLNLSQGHAGVEGGHDEAGHRASDHERAGVKVRGGGMGHPVPAAGTTGTSICSASGFGSFRTLQRGIGQICGARAGLGLCVENSVVSPATPLSAHSRRCSELNAPP
jgi:hypothetical protein